MKRAFIVHCWGGDSNYAWYQSVAKQLELRGYQVQIPNMPDTEEPRIDKWLLKLSETIGTPDDKLILIGHSIGCQTILRYLESLSNNQTIAQAIFVAPWTHLINLDKESQEIARPWLESPINWNAVKSHCRSFHAIFSDNDEWVPLSEEEIFKSKLGATSVILSNCGHFEDITSLNEVLEVI